MVEDVFCVIYYNLCWSDLEERELHDHKESLDLPQVLCWFQMSILCKIMKYFYLIIYGEWHDSWLKSQAKCKFRTTKITFHGRPYHYFLLFAPVLFSTETSKKTRRKSLSNPSDDWLWDGWLDESESPMCPFWALDPYHNSFPFASFYCSCTRQEIVF